ncbi:hypothetical protein ABTZ12_04665 [Escherichia coli]|uniref:hypothetical protein n=1 Tax=Escherichia coli TaxID=562 RepID=UPI003315D9AD
MKIYSITGSVIIDTASVHLFLDSSEKKTGLFTVRRYNNNYNCPVRGGGNSYRLVQATEDDSPEKTFGAYYLPYVRNDVTSLLLAYDDGFDYFFTDTLDGCSVGVETTELATHVYHANSYNYGQYLYNKEKVNLGFAFRRQVCAQNKMIKNASGNNAEIVSPWDYGHFGENAKYFKTLLYGHRDRFSRRWYFLRQTYDIRNFENSWFR